MKLGAQNRLSESPESKKNKLNGVQPSQKYHQLNEFSMSRRDQQNHLKLSLFFLAKFFLFAKSRFAIYVFKKLLLTPLSSGQRSHLVW